MAWTTPKSWSATTLTSAELNEQVRDNENWLKDALTTIGQTSSSVLGQVKAAPYGCVLIRTATQSIPDSTNTTVTFATANMTEQLDSDGFHSGSSNTSRITIPAGGDGWYMIGANVAFDISATGVRTVAVELNGGAGTGTTIISENKDSFATNANRVTIGAPYLLSAADYVTLNVTQTSGGALDILANDYSVRFWCYRIFAT